ncbi:hypothetical protein ACFUJR_15905 [Streptomyces sp. NPDC057271]|uniref:hypothetical protein n=1 Tax=unclassified Streptomyces TaxID=2593676 RepID=UPI003625A0C5
MIAGFRSAIHATGARRSARQDADVQFCDGCAEIRGSACRAAAHPRRTRASALAFGPR